MSENSNETRGNEKFNFLKLLPIIFVIVVIVTFVMMFDIKNKIENGEIKGAENTVENKVEEVEEKVENVVENVVEEKVDEDEEEEDEPEEESTINTNVISDQKREEISTIDNKEKAVKMVEKKYGTDKNLVYFCDSILKSGEFIVGVKEKNSSTVSAYYKVDLEAETIKLMY